MVRFCWTKGVRDGQETVYAGADHHHALGGRGAPQPRDSDG
jgi:hypothetical protein